MVVLSSMRFTVATMLWTILRGWISACVTIASEVVPTLRIEISLRSRWLNEYPECLHSQPSAKFPETPRFMYYSEHKILKLPSLENLEADLSTDLAFQLQPRKLSHEDLAVARVKGGLMIEEGRYSIVAVDKSAESTGNRILHWSTMDPELLVTSLQEKGCYAQLRKMVQVLVTRALCVSMNPKRL